MNESKSRPSSRPGSAPNNTKTMTVLQPKSISRPSSQRSKALTKKPLERATKIASSASSSSGFTYKTPVLDPVEKKKLDILTSKPLDRQAFSSLSQKSAELSQYDKEREQRFKEIQSFIDNLRDTKSQDSKAELEEIESEISMREAKEQEDMIEDDLDISSVELTKRSYAGMEEKLVERERLIRSISSFTDYLKQQEDDEGNKIVDFPENFQDIVEFAVEHSVSMKQIDESYTPEDINWLEVYDTKKNNSKPEHQTALTKIKQLDKTLQDIERKHKQLKLQWSSEDSKDSIDREPAFITHLKSRKHSYTPSSASSKISRRTLPDKILKNIETASSYKGHYSFIDRLAGSEKEKLSRLLEEGKLELARIDECTGIIPDESIERLSEIDDKLKKYVPESFWEEKSISVPYRGAENLNSTNSPFSFTSKNKKNKVQPADPALREEKERREAQQKLSEINTSLLKLHNKTSDKPTEDEINKLMLNAMMTIDESEVIHSYAIQDERNSVLQGAKDLLEKIERRNMVASDDESIIELLDEAQIAIDKYEELCRNEMIIKESSPEYMRYKQRLESYLNVCKETQRDVDNAMDRLNCIERKLVQVQDAFARTDYINIDLEGQINSLNLNKSVTVDKELDMEAFEQEIESKALESIQGTEIRFKMLEMLNVENFPLVYDVLENIKPDEFHDFEADEEYQAMLRRYMNPTEDEEDKVEGDI